MGDAPELWDYLSHSHVNCLLHERIDTIEEAIANAKKEKRTNCSLPAVCLKEDDKVIGNLFALKEEPDTFSVGWQFYARYEGKGYASEAAKVYILKLFLNNAFDFDRLFS